MDLDIRYPNNNDYLEEEHDHDGKIMNYDELLSFIDSSTTTMEDLNKLANSIRNNQYAITRDDLIHIQTLLSKIKEKQDTLLHSSVSQNNEEGLLNSFMNEDEYNFPSVSSKDMGYAKTLKGPGSPKKSHMRSDHSILNNINGSVLAVGLMMLNVVIVGIMYIILAIAKIGG